MNITPRAQMLGDLKPLDSSHFAGRAAARDLLVAQKPALPTTAIVVRFEPGARNHWHSHDGGQVLYVIDGAGWVQVRRGTPQRIRLDDTVRAERGEEHSHGAGRSGPLAHIAIHGGEARWLEESPEPPD